ncbi:aldose 1-epimerase [Acidianus sp. RZ1]|uniref:aldose 1-epimerase n=1 Tax=Acidianus sp. RZ1 TaxID=1540082 RepID=UPI0014912F66|nr:aldose 1-epimerase [Acidianus sp. RZ1]NON62143.1 aldose 1-epimerase [Acidianus sp. RZ1]
MPFIKARKAKAKALRKGAYLSLLYIEGLEILKPGIYEHLTHGGMAILLPYANRVFNATYTWEGRTYHLPKAKGQNYSIHGLVRNKIWKVRRFDKSSITMEYTLSHKGYPTTLNCFVTYSLSSNGLTVNLEVKNIGDIRSPLTVGFHPYFIFKNTWKLECEKNVNILNISPEKVTQRSQECSKIRFPNSFDTTFKGGGELILISEDRKLKIRRNNMEFFQVYNGEWAGNDSVAIEPMSGPPYAFNNGYGLSAIEPYQTLKFGFNIIVEKLV